MIERYTREEMGSVWTEENKYQKWLDIEIAVCEAQEELGFIPKKSLESIKKNAKFNVDRILEIEKTTKHDVVAFLTNVAEYVGDDARYIHLGMTSSDVLDTSLALLMVEAGNLILTDLSNLIAVLKRRALEFKDTIMIGRSHGIHAEPITFGCKLAVWYDETKRNYDRMERAIESARVGQVSGAVGNFQHIDPKVEFFVCEKLGLKAAPVSTQIIQRDRHAEYIWALAMIASSLEKFATEVRLLQRTEVLEAEEYFSKGQKGSSAMPHKRNPIASENISGLARLIRANLMAAMQNIALWHERDISHSSVERIILPDSTILVDYMLNRFTNVLDQLLVYPDKMKENIKTTRNLMFSEAVLLSLVNTGLSREEAYRIVQENAMKTWSSDKDFKTIIQQDERVKNILSHKEIEQCFDVNYSLRNVDTVFKKAGLD